MFPRNVSFYAIIFILGLILVFSPTLFIARVWFSGNSSGQNRSYGVKAVSDQQQRIQSEVLNGMLYYGDGSSMSRDEFSCVGRCYCGELDRRRYSVVSKPLIFATSAVSAMAAVFIANQYFEKECSRLYSHVCAESEIGIDIEKCEGKHEVDGDFSTEEDEVVSDYRCIGHCMKREDLSRKETLEAQSSFNCEKLVMVRRLRVPLPLSGNYRLKWDSASDKLFPSTEGSLNLNSVAKSKFKSEFLVPFCKEASRQKFAFAYEFNGEPKTIYRSATLCVGGKKGTPNISCSKLGME